ncbi:SDR family oxidoreductase [Pedobacter rhizosphaerae]|uniref:NADP-dependent 3-hydroxy acid dehydrogenase YdfG n=1 Tax=Pedobacter rhizosphaerae TaxID=390241 RepID=A0A1H9U708_9SPHI|nr:SDR family oxidoreductase [Pedobacter rhizosphaerae]SES04883.1 NADP-dependent 3-hydroxy acid dehydrogenase YdfG [Pedobacter rhizosphaerae]
MKTIFITGASTGLGKATAKLFQQNGWKVIATMRQPEQATELADLENITVLPLDVTNLEQINHTVQLAIQLGVDVVFNNAGYGLVGAMEAISDEQLQKQINTNLLGVLRVSQAFIPYFRKRNSGMFITTTSMGGLFTLPLGSVYHATKFALEGWSESLSYEMALFNVSVKTVAPGGIATDFAGRSIDKPSHPVYDEVDRKLWALFDFDSFSTAEQIASVVYEAATDGKNQVRYVAGNDANTLYARYREIGNEEFRKEISKTILGI